MKSLYHSKKVLVSGGAGFIGSHIVDKLIELGADVTVLDNLSSGKKENLEKSINKINFIEGDIQNFDTCIQGCKNQEIIFHLAALVSVQQSIENPDLCYKINTKGTNNLLSAAANSKVKTFIFSSSAAIYGDRLEECFENDKPNPKSPYAQSKLDGEYLCRNFYKQHGLNTAILRYFNVFGERQNPNGDYAGVVAKFKTKLTQNQPIIIYGNGMQTRDFIEVSQVVNANLNLGIQSNLNSEIFNIATGKCINLFELIFNLLKQLNKNQVTIEFHPSRSGDIFISKANCDKYKKSHCNYF